MPEALVAPSARDLTRTYMLAQLSARGITGSWTDKVPEVRPDRFFTIEELNSAAEFGFIADSQLLQVRCYDTDGKRCAQTARLVKGLWLVMPNELFVQNVAIPGGPTHQADPDVPGLTRYLITAWVTVMNFVA